MTGQRPRHRRAAKKRNELPPPHASPLGVWRKYRIGQSNTLEGERCNFDRRCLVEAGIRNRDVAAAHGAQRRVIRGTTRDYAPSALHPGDSLTASGSNSRRRRRTTGSPRRSEEHTSELQSPYDLVCRLLLAK